MITKLRTKNQLLVIMTYIRTPLVLKHGCSAVCHWARTEGLAGLNRNSFEPAQSCGKFYSTVQHIQENFLRKGNQY